MALELRFTIPGQVERQVPLDQQTIKIGALLSNQIVLRAPGVDPIHALIEEIGPGEVIITDLGSVAGVRLNDQLIDVESLIKDGDTIIVGSVTLHVVESQTQAAVVSDGAAGRHGATVRSPESRERRDTPEGTLVAGVPEVKVDNRERQKDLLFSPRKARPSGDVLEVVAYWGDTVLDVELFHPSFKGFEAVTIGDPTKAHLIAAGKTHVDFHQMARFSGSGYKITLLEGMSARLRKGGKVEKVNKPGDISLGNRDIAHIKFGAVSYFLMFVKPPPLDFPKTGVRDPFFIGLMSFAFLFYAIMMPLAWTHVPSPEKKDKDDIWQVLQVPEKEQEKEKQKPPEKPKPEVKIAEVKTPPKKPPPPKPKPEIKPVKPVEKEKPVQTKPVEKPVEIKKPTEVLTEQKPTPPKPPETKPAESKPKAAAADKPNLNKLSAGMPSTGAKAPNFKAAGPTLPNTAIGKSGGAVGSGMNQAGAPIKGKSNASTMGVEGVNNDKASGVNLSKLGLGVGKIMSKTGAGAINTNFKDSAGGAGGGMGSAGKTYGLGGLGSGKSLGLAGSGGAVNNFGSGSGGLLGGQGGSGGNGGSGLGPGFGNGGAGGAGGAGGHGRANVSVPAGDPVVSGGLTSQEIMAVIRANLNQIRHCYEQLLQRSPSASGKMGTTFVIDTAGRVSSVSVSQDTVNDSMMRGCVTGKMQRWAFPKPRGGQPVSVNYPFVFNPL